jgi:hypothetical protein
MSPTHHIRTALVLLWAGWIAYTCFKRAITPPKNRASRWGYNEVEAVNKHPLVRALMIVCGLLILVIAIDVVLGK